MQITSPSRTRQPAGYALIMIMILVAVMLTIFASMLFWVSSNANVSIRNNAYTSAEAAAESATETVLAPMIRDYDFGSLNTLSTYTGITPDQTGWPISYSFPSNYLYIDRSQEGILSPLSTQFAGEIQSGFVDYVTNRFTALANNGPVAVPATVELDLEFAAIPLYQYAIFYNMDLEICPGAAMNILGHVHSNNNIYYTGNGSSTQLIFSNLVDSTGFSTNSRSPNDPQSWTSGNYSFQPNQPVQKVPPMTMPIGTNNDPATVIGIIQFPPASLAIPSAVAYSPTGSVYFYNASDLIITNSAASPTTLTVLYNNGNDPVTPIRTVPPDVQVVVSNGPTSFTTNSYYSFVTNATFYDYRESDTVKAIQIDVGALNAWLLNNATVVTKIGNTNIYVGGTNSGHYFNQKTTTDITTAKGHNINSIYVYNSVTPTNTTLPAVRLVNAAQLPSTTLLGNGLIAGLTVATAQPIYTVGNYNVTNNGATALTLGSTISGGTAPASLVGDSLTILSSQWSDSYSLSHTGDTTPNGRPAIQTTVNAATMEGIVQSVTANGTKQYSGGVENFLRMQENWSGVNLTYNGSIVVLFPSQYATNYWINPGTYYNPPNRYWGFDLNFLKGQNYLPPLTPRTKKVIRSAYSAW